MLSRDTVKISQVGSAKKLVPLCLKTGWACGTLFFILLFLTGCVTNQKEGYSLKNRIRAESEALVKKQQDDERQRKAIVLFNNGFQLINNDPIGANALYREGIILMPERWEAYYNLGITYMKLYDHERAIKEFSNALKYNAPQSKVYNAIGVTYQSMGRNGDAIKYFKKALSLEKSPIVIMNIANIYQDMGQKEESIKLYHQIEFVDISKLPLHNNIGSLKYKMGDFKGARDEFNMALEKEGENIQVLYYQAQTLLMLEEYENALNVYKKIAAKNSADPEPYRNMGIIYEIYLGDMASAYENYTAYIKNGGEKTKDMESWIEVVKVKMVKKEGQ
ncbi:MAG: tetratricopeptide repeat protein [Nitrospinae bacterium]|nr:tetratricopeptide repeat protein [Nitrospinota bacterium]